MATSKKAAKPAKIKVRIGGVYKDGRNLKVEIVGRVRGDGKCDFLGIVRNEYGPRSDGITKFSKTGQSEVLVDEFDLVREIA